MVELEDFRQYRHCGEAVSCLVPGQFLLQFKGIRLAYVRGFYDPPVHEFLYPFFADVVEVFSQSLHRLGKLDFNTLLLNVMHVRPDVLVLPGAYLNVLYEKHPLYFLYLGPLRSRGSGKRHYQGLAGRRQVRLGDVRIGIVTYGPVRLVKDAKRKIFQGKYPALEVVFYSLRGRKYHVRLPVKPLPARRSRAACDYRHLKASSHVFSKSGALLFYQGPGGRKE